MLDSIGLLLLAATLASAGLCIAAWKSGRRSRNMLLGISLLFFFLAALTMTDRLLPALVTTSDDTRETIHRVLAGLAALAGAFATDAAIKRFIWYGTLRQGDHSKVPDILIGLATVGGYAITIMLIASVILERDITAIAATSGVVAIVLGYSAQQTLGQVFAGLALNMQQPFRAGDSVQIDGVWGVVEQLDWRAVSLRTYDGNLVIMPNTLVASTKITNLDQPTHDVRHHIPFVADINAPPGKVRAVAMAAMRASPHALDKPSPMVLFKDFTDRGVLYEAIFWHHDPNVYILRRDEVGNALWYALHRAGIRIALLRRLLDEPHDGAAAHANDGRDHQISADPAHIQHHLDRGKLLAILRRSPLYEGFPPEAVEDLAGAAICRLYGEGERIMRQGEPGSSMFVILEGRVSVRRYDEHGIEREVSSFGPGDTFGHMSLMTGAPRIATIRALSHLVLAEIEKDAIAPLIAQYPAAIERVAKEIMALEAESARVAQSQAAATHDGDEHGLLDRLSDRIRGFFGAGRGH